MTEIDIPDDGGTYALIFRSSTKRTIRIGLLGSLPVQPGFYIYVGSAFGPGGLRARVCRHARRNKKRHWHIDFLRPHADLECAWYGVRKDKQEHDWAKAFAAAFQPEIPLRRFGASDCRCDSHLFYSPKRPSLAEFRRRLDSRGPDAKGGPFSTVNVWRPPGNG